VAELLQYGAARQVLGRVLRPRGSSDCYIAHMHTPHIIIHVHDEIVSRLVAELKPTLSNQTAAGQLQLL